AEEDERGDGQGSEVEGAVLPELAANGPEEAAGFGDARGGGGLRGVGEGWAADPVGRRRRRRRRRWWGCGGRRAVRAARGGRGRRAGWCGRRFDVRGWDGGPGQLEAGRG